MSRPATRCAFTARDSSRRTTRDESEQAIQEAGLLLDLLTPIAKSWPSQWCLEANSLAIQIHGGYGYTREYPVEQFYRDNRLNPIHEGTHGIQAIDLLGRKAVMQRRRGNGTVCARSRQDPRRGTRGRRACPYAAELQAALNEIATTLTALGPGAGRNPTLALANAVLFLDAFGHTVMAWIWLRQALAAQRGLAAGIAADTDFYRGKLAACRWFYRWELPKTPMARTPAQPRRHHPHHSRRKLLSP
jgi:hypothetical protein